MFAWFGLGVAVPDRYHEVTKAPISTSKQHSRIGELSVYHSCITVVEHDLIVITPTTHMLTRGTSVVLWLRTEFLHGPLIGIPFLHGPFILYWQLQVIIMTPDTRDIVPGVCLGRIKILL